MARNENLSGRYAGQAKVEDNVAFYDEPDNNLPADRGEGLSGEELAETPAAVELTPAEKQRIELIAALTEINARMQEHITLLLGFNEMAMRARVQGVVNTDSFAAMVKDFSTNYLRLVQGIQVELQDRLVAPNILGNMVDEIQQQFDRYAGKYSLPLDKDGRTMKQILAAEDSRVISRSLNLINGAIGDFRRIASRPISTVTQQ